MVYVARATADMLSVCSLFAAKAGASKVVAVDGSAKMASVATQVRLVLPQSCIHFKI